MQSTEISQEPMASPEPARFQIPRYDSLWVTMPFLAAGATRFFYPEWTDVTTLDSVVIGVFGTWFLVGLVAQFTPALNPDNPRVPRWLVSLLHGGPMGG